MRNRKVQSRQRHRHIGSQTLTSRRNPEYQTQPERSTRRTLDTENETHRRVTDLRQRHWSGGPTITCWEDWSGWINEKRLSKRRDAIDPGFLGVGGGGGCGFIPNKGFSPATTEQGTSNTNQQPEGRVQPETSTSSEKMRREHSSGPVPGRGKRTVGNTRKLNTVHHVL